MIKHAGPSFISTAKLKLATKAWDWRAAEHSTPRFRSTTVRSFRSSGQDPKPSRDAEQSARTSAWGVVPRKPESRRRLQWLPGAVPASVPSLNATAARLLTETRDGDKTASDSVNGTDGREAQAVRAGARYSLTIAFRLGPRRPHQISQFRVHGSSFGAGAAGAGSSHHPTASGLGRTALSLLALPLRHESI